MAKHPSNKQWEYPPEDQTSTSSSTNNYSNPSLFGSIGTLTQASTARSDCDIDQSLHNSTVFLLSKTTEKKDNRNREGNKHPDRSNQS
jgi:hypothetical protein